MYCPKCGRDSTHIEHQGESIQLYCYHCGYLIKWNETDESDTSSDVITKLHMAVEYLSDLIETEYNRMPIQGAAMQITDNYCRGLAFAKHGIENILNGKNFNEKSSFISLALADGMNDEE